MSRFVESYLENVPLFSLSHYLFSFFVLDRTIAQDADSSFDQNTILSVLNLTFSTASYEVQINTSIAVKSLKILQNLEGLLFLVPWPQIIQESLKNAEQEIAKFGLSQQYEALQNSLEMILAHYWQKYSLFQGFLKEERWRNKLSCLIECILNNLLRVCSNLEIRDDYFVFTTWFFEKSPLQNFFLSKEVFLQHLWWHKKYRQHESFRSLGPFIAIRRTKQSRT